MNSGESFHYQLDAQVGSFQVFPNGEIRFASIGDLFQEIAWKHADSGGFGISLMENNQMWALARLDIQTEKMPKWGDEVRLFTAGRGVNKLFAFREFLMLSDQDEVLVKGMSSWLLLDTVSKRPIRPSSVLPPELFDPNLITPWQPEKIKVEGSLISEQKIQVRFSDLDLNNHVNNTSYIRWAEDILMENGIEMKSLSINYLSEAHLQDLVYLSVYKSGRTFFVSGTTEGSPVFLAEVAID